MTASRVLTPHRLALALAAGSLLTLLPGAADAQVLPTGPTVVAGQAQVAVNGNSMTVTNSANTILNWQSFSIGAQNSVRFQQPGATSQVLNRVTGNDPSQILGQLSSNGKVWLLNPNGVLFGQGARIDVAGLVTSTLRLNDQDWLAGRYAFTAGEPGASVLNQGELRSTLGGRIVLLGGSVRNEGLIDAPGGQVLLAAGDSLELIDTGAPNLTVKLTASQGEALNLGTLRAAGGRIDVHAAVVNQQGLVQADALSAGPGGEIVLQASERLNLADGSVTRATAADGQGGQVQLLGREVGLFGTAAVDASGTTGGGQVLVGGGLQGKDASVPNAEAVYFGRDATIKADATVQGDGGRIILWSDDATRAFGSLSARGGAQGGDGGFIETSGGWLDARPLAVDVGAARGKVGQWLLDPHNVEISDDPTNSGYDASFTATADDALISASAITTALNAGTHVTISTSSDGTGGTQEGLITVSGAHILVNAATPGSLTLIADADIYMSASTISSSGGAMPVSLLAGRGSYGSISILNSTISTAGGTLLLGGYGSGLNPDGSSFTNATKGNGSVTPNGVHVGISSVLDAGAGRLEINASSDGAEAIQLDGNSQFNAADIVLRGYSTVYGGVDISEAALSATHSIAISGRGAGQGVSIGNGSSYATTLSVTPAAPDSSAHLTVSGLSDDSSSGVSINSFYSQTQLKVSQGATLSVSGGNVATDAQDAVYLYNGNGGSSDPTQALLYSDASGGAISIRATETDNVVSLSGLAATATAAGISVSTGGTISVQNAQLQAGGLIDMSADQITLGTGTVLSSSASGEAIWLRGATADGLSYFQNDGGAGALLVPNGRWIIWGTRILDASDNFADGGLAYDFKRYGVTGTAAWAGDSGNGFVFSGVETASYGLQLQNKVYDGTATAVLLAGSATGVNGDAGSLGANATAAFADKNVGTHAVSLTSVEPFAMTDGNGKPVYGYTFVGSDSASITPATLSATVTANNKVYDGTTAATVSIGALNGLVGTETVGVNAVAVFADKNVGSAKTLSGVQYSLADGTNGGLASNYQFSPAASLLSADITPLAISISGLLAAGKVYDAGTGATLSGTASVTALTGDVLTLNGTAVGQFADKNVGTGKAVRVSGLSLGGADAGNYTLSAPTLTADITPAILILSGLRALDKVYDATTAATLAGTASLSSALGSDQVSLSGSGVGSFADKNVGTGKAVSVGGYALSGADAGNYTLAQPALRAAITPAQLSYVADAATRFVGETLTGLGGTVSGFVGGETQASATTGTLAFSGPGNANTPGYYAIDGSGLSAANYVFVQAPGNAQALTLLPVKADSGGAGADVSVQAAMQTLSLPAPPSSPLNSGLADLSSASTVGASAGSISGASNGAAADFGSVRLDGLSLGELQTLLDSRDRYKKTLFAESISKLEQDPSLADIKPCASLQDAASGTCLITETLKAQAQAQAQTQAGSTAQATPIPAVAPAAPAQAANIPAVAAASAAPPPTPALLPALMTSKRRVQIASLPQIERKVALVIGVNRYDDASIPQLGNAVGDAEAMGRLFESKLGYETVVIENASKQAVVAALNRLALELGPRDSALVYYAGHGELIESTGQGYWQLSDSDAKKPESWLSNADIARLVQQIGASQVALISDSCYSGALVGGERIRAMPGKVDPGQLLTQKAVVVMSSGGNEPVFDAGKGGHSPFAWNLMNTLGQVSNWQPGGNVFERVRFAVARELPQRPQYGAASGHQAGADYLFEQRKLEQVAPPPPTP